MKKAILILVIGLFWCNVGFSKILPNDSPEEQYQFAIRFIKIADYENAELALREFVEINPDHELTGNAHYWYAETFRVRQLYKDAATAYLYGFEHYPKSPKAPMNQLKLGTMLVIIGQWNQGCEIISGVESQYPKAAQSVLTKAKEEYKNYRCQKSAKGPRDKYKIKGQVDTGRSVITGIPKKKKPKAVAKEEKCIKGNCSNGEGTKSLLYGTYVGEFKDGKEHGQGILTYADGDIYVGEWKDGEPNGQGSWTYSNGSIVNGIWRNGRIVERNNKVAKRSEKAILLKLSKEEVNKLKAEIKENGVTPYERGIVADEREYALLIKEQHEFVKTEKATILKDIDKSKKICIDMGFSETTLLIFKNEKFNQCILTIWKTELRGKKYAKMQKELDTQLAEIKQKQIELNDVASALDRTRDQQITRVTEVQQSSGLESLIKGALGIAAGYYIGQAIGGSSGTSGQTSQGNTTILRGYRCTLHPTAFDC